jgi:hypothetical protein
VAVGVDVSSGPGGELGSSRLVSGVSDPRSGGAVGTFSLSMTGGQVLVLIMIKFTLMHLGK